MLPLLGAAVSMMVFEAAAILASTGMCTKYSKLKRRGGKRYRGDVGDGNGYGTRGRNGIGTTGVIFASGLGDGDGGSYRGDGGGGDAAGSDHGGGTDSGYGDGGDDGGDNGGGCGGGCGGGGDD